MPDKPALIELDTGPPTGVLVVTEPATPAVAGAVANGGAVSSLTAQPTVVLPLGEVPAVPQPLLSAPQDAGLGAPVVSAPGAKRPWGDYIPDLQTLEEWKAIGFTFIERKLATASALRGVYSLPKDMAEVCPKLHSWFRAAVVLVGGIVTYSDASIGNVAHAKVWSNNQTEAQAYLDSLTTDARRADRRLLISVIDFFQSLVSKTELPIRDPTVGLYRSAALFAEVFFEERNRVPRSVTARDLQRSALKNQLMEQVKQVFLTDGVAALIVNLAEVLLCQVYKKVSVLVEPEYTEALIEAIRPSVSALADGLYRREKVKEQVMEQRGPRRVAVEKEVVKVRPPAVKCSDKEIGTLFDPAEVMLLKDINASLTASRAKDQLEQYRDDSLRVQMEKVDTYVRRTYALSDAVNAFVKSRNDRLKSICVARAKQMIKEKTAVDMKAAFTKELWDETASEYRMTRSQDGVPALVDLLRDLRFLEGEEERLPRDAIARFVAL